MSSEEVISRTMSKITQLIDQMVPPETCPVKKAKREWKVEEIKKEVAERLTNKSK